mgnify:CR=1 FL=1|jgi:hypothetical protein
MTASSTEKLPYRLWELAFRVSGDVLSAIGWPPFRKFVEARTTSDLVGDLHSLCDDLGQAQLDLFQSSDPEERDDASFVSDLLHPLRALVLLLYDNNLSDSERHFQRLRELMAGTQLQRELDYPRGIGRWLLARSLCGLALAACRRADDRTLAQLRDDDEEARQRVLDRLGSRVLTVPGRWRELGSFIHGEHNQLLEKLAIPVAKLSESKLRADWLPDLFKPYAHLSSLYLSPNIPEKKLRNARKFCEVPDEEDVLALLDCTVFGSASDALLFGVKHIFFRNFIAQNGRPGRLLYGDLAVMSLQRGNEGELLFAEGQIANVSGSGLSVTDLMSLIRELQKRLQSG